MAKPPSPERIRLTVAVTPEVHDTFKRMADATGISLSRAMGDWLTDTVEGAQLLTLQLEKARAAPKVAIREMQAGLHGLQQEMTQLLDDIRTGKKAIPPGKAAGGGAGLPDTRAAASGTPRPVIRGGKVQVNTPHTATATTIDWLRFRTQADPGEALQALRPMFGTLGHHLTFGDPCRGVLGYQRGIPIKLADATLGRMDWGGDSQRGWLRVDVPGKGCGFVEDWDALEDVEALPSAEIRRLDIALTTWSGEVKHEDVVQAHERGEFTTRGRPPNLQQITNSDPNAGRTCYVGKRDGDKFFRAYEKGFELRAKLGASRLGTHITHIDGHAVEDIYRCELELKADGTDIPWETVERRDQYFSGAYPFCARILPGIEPDILQRRPEKAPQRELQAMLANIRTQYGNALFTALTCYHGDIGAVWQKVCGTEHHAGMLEAGVLLVSHED